jgi:hypothetical protein
MSDYVPFMKVKEVEDSSSCWVVWYVCLPFENRTNDYKFYYSPGDGAIHDYDWIKTKSVDVVYAQLWRLTTADWKLEDDWNSDHA